MKKIISSILLSSVILITGSALSAQQDPLYAQYVFNKMILNPAYAGMNGDIAAVISSRHQWVGIEGAPQTQTLSVHMPLNDEVGAGLSLLRDQAGPLNTYDAELNVAYHLQVDNQSQLSFGLMGGISYANIRMIEIEGVLDEDEAFQQNLSASRPVFGAGLYYQHPDFYAGISMPDLIETDYENELATYTHFRHIYLTGSYIGRINDDIWLQPMAMLRYVQNTALSAEAGLAAIIMKKYGFGLFYRYENAVGAMISVQINEQFRFGYSYDYSLNALSSYQSGSHEICLSYGLNMNPESSSTPFF